METESPFEPNQDISIDYQVLITKYMAAIDQIRAQMADTQVEIDRLKAETQAILVRVNTTFCDSS